MHKAFLFGCYVAPGRWASLSISTLRSFGRVALFPKSLMRFDRKLEKKATKLRLGLRRLEIRFAESKCLLIDAGKCTQRIAESGFFSLAYVGGVVSDTVEQTEKIIP
jgi:hypothetical protein